MAQTALTRTYPQLGHLTGSEQCLGEPNTAQTSSLKRQLEMFPEGMTRTDTTLGNLDLLHKTTPTVNFSVEKLLPKKKKKKDRKR